jgi:hypothetical protein
LKWKWYNWEKGRKMIRFLEWIKDNKGKTIALAISLLYLILGFFMDGMAGVLKISMFLVFVLACIFFGDYMGGYTGILSKGPITKTTPGCFITFMGWILLLLPLLATIFMAIFENNK